MRTLARSHRPAKAVAPQLAGTVRQHHTGLLPPALAGRARRAPTIAAAAGAGHKSHH